MTHHPPFRSAIPSNDNDDVTPRPPQLDAMAVLDQHHDDFSNVSWHTEQNEAAESSSSVTGPNPDDSDRNGHSAFDSDTADTTGQEVLDCTVSEPLKENDGSKDTFVSYLITTNVRQLASFVPVICRAATEGCLRANTATTDDLCYLPEITSISPPSVHRFCLPV